MNKKALTIITFILLSITIKAQNNDSLIGKWVFKDLYNKEKINATGLQMLKSEIINKMTFDFKKDSSFNAFAMGEKMNGTWALSKDSKRIILKTTTDGLFKFLILKLTDTELVLKLGLGEFLMEKIKTR